MDSPDLWLTPPTRVLSEELQKPQPLLVSKKVLQYTSNLYGSMPPICIAVPSWLLSFKQRETQQYTSPNIAIRLPFVLQYASHLYGSTFEKVQGVGVTGKFLILERYHTKEWAGGSSGQGFCYTRCCVPILQFLFVQSGDPPPDPTPTSLLRRAVLKVVSARNAVQP